MRQRRRPTARATTVVALVTTLACGGDAGSAPPSQSALAGTFTLTDVDGAPVSAMPPSSTQLLSGFLVFEGTDQARRVVTTRVSPAFAAPYVVTDTVVHSYLRDGSRVLFRYPSGSLVVDTGTVTSTASAVRIDVHTRLGLDVYHTATFLQQK